MNDARLTPSNGSVAHESLRGKVDAQRFVKGEPRRIVAPVASLWRGPAGGPRDRQLLYGDLFLVLEDCGARAFGFSQKDGYVGYVRVDELGPAVDATHIVCARTTQLYPSAGIKAVENLTLPFGSQLRIAGAQGDFCRTQCGQFAPRCHLRPLCEHFDDPVDVAELFLGVPYLWGGNSIWGIDCSGLVQAALLACGVACPGDSDLQEKALGASVDKDASVLRGDLFFWKGHVAMAVDRETLIHANAHEMAVALEPIADAVRRIERQGDGPVTSRRRINGS